MTAQQMTVQQHARHVAVQACEALVSACWHQWSVLGFAGTSRASSGSDVLIDPKALILASLMARDDEKRLDDALGWWVGAGLHVTSRHRARALMKRWPSEVRARWPALALLARASGAAGWDADAKREADVTLAPRPGKGSASVQVKDGAALMVRLRLGLGTGARADLVAWLMGRGSLPGSIRQAQSALGYSGVALRTAAGEMVQAGLLLAESGGALRVRPASAWFGLLGVTEAPRWDGSNRLLRLTDVIITEARGRSDAWSEYVWKSRARDLAERHGLEGKRADWDLLVKG